MKKLSLLLVTMLIVLALTGCWAGEVKSDLTINTDKGGGTQTISIDILKDHVTKPDNNGTVDDNSLYFPSGMDAVTKWLKANVPSGFTVDFKDEADKWVYSILYSFTDINDYNAKTKKLIGDARWSSEGLQEATLATEQADGGVKVTFTENAANLKAAATQYIEQVYNNKDLFDPKKGQDVSPVTLDQVFAVKTANLKVGDSATSFTLNDPANPVDVITLSGVVKAGETAASGNSGKDTGSAPAKTTNPKTGDNGNQYYWYIVAGIVGLAAVYVSSRKRSMN